MKRIIQTFVLIISLSAFSENVLACGKLLNPDAWSKANKHPAKGVCPKRETNNPHLNRFCISSAKNPSLAFTVTMVSFGKLCERRKIGTAELEYFWGLAGKATVDTVNPGYEPVYFMHKLTLKREDVAVEFNKIGRICFKNNSISAMDELKKCKYLKSLNYPFI